MTTHEKWEPQEPGETPASLPAGAALPAGRWPPERPVGWPGCLAWPPDQDEMLALEGFRHGMTPMGCTFALSLVELGRGAAESPLDLADPAAREFADRAVAQAFRARGWRTLPTKSPRPPLSPEDEARAAAAAAEEEAGLLRAFEADLAAATANGLPPDPGAAALELAKRLARSRDFQVFELAAQERAEARLPGARERADYDLAIARHAARETRYAPHLYELVSRLSWLYPHDQPDRRPPWPAYHGYIEGTVRQALASAQSAAAPAASRTVAELAADEALLAPPAAVVPRLAWRGRDTLFAGREKLAGKSTLLTAAAAAVTRGAPFLGGAAARGHVLWVSADFEPEADVVQRFLRFGGDPRGMTVAYPGPGGFDARLDALVGDVARRDPALVVVDSLAPFMLVDEASQSTEWIARFAAFRERLKPHGAARVFAHHTTKGTGEYRDSTAIGAAVDQILYYENPEPRAGTPVRRVWGLGRIVGWRPFDVRLEGDAFALVEPPSAAAIEANEDGAVLARVAARPGQSTTDIAGGLGRNKQEVTDALARLAAAGKVEDRGHSRNHAWHAVVPGAQNDAP